MAGNIKGVTIVFEGDTTKLDKALRDVRKSTKDIDSELRKVNNSLKFNPGNVDLLRQKQTLLNQKIEQTENNLKDLRNMQKQVANDPNQGKNSAAYRELQREIIKSENQLKRFNAEQRKIKAALSPLGQFGTKMKDVGTKLTKAGNAMRQFSMAGAAVAVTIGGLTAKSAKWADDIVTQSKVYSMSTKELQKYNAAAELVDVNATAIVSTHRKLERNMLNAQLGSKKQALAFKELGIAYKNADGTLRDGDEVWSDTIEALSKMKNETTRDAYAMALMGRSATELNPLIEDGAEGYRALTEAMQKYDLKFIDDKTLQNANDFNDQLDTIKAIGAITFQTIGTRLAAYLVPALEKTVDLVGRIASWLQNLSPQVLAIAGALGAILAVIAPLLLIAGAFASAIGSISSAMALFGVTVNIALGPLALIVAAIAAVIAIGVLLYKNWDQIMARLRGLQKGFVLVWNGIKTKTIAAVKNLVSMLKHDFNTIKTVATTVFNAVKNAIVNPIKNAVTIVKALIGKIKGFFPLNIGKIFSGLKLPHFKVTGGKAPWGIGGKGSLPKFDVDWYARGAIFNSPNIIGVGEAGPEAVVPLDKFWNKLDNMASGGTQIVININGADRDKYEIAQEVKRVLIRETNQRRLAWQ